MSYIFPEFSKPFGFSIYLDGKYRPVNSAYAEKFHTIIKSDLGITVIGSRVTCTQDGSLMMNLYSKTDEVTSALWGDNRFLSCIDKYPQIVKDVILCLQKAVSEFGIAFPEEITHLNFALQSFEDYATDTLLYDTTRRVSKALKVKFGYNVFVYGGRFTEKSRQSSHLFMFETKYDVERVKREGLLEKMIDEAYNSIYEIDEGRTLVRDKYDVIVKSKDQYSKEELFLLSRT